MKKILITGANSYIGTSFERYINAHHADRYQVDTVDMIDGTWREKSFAGYDTVFHVAGIAHQKETAENAPLYYSINRDLAYETACKAKAEGIKQFIYLSSMSVYGMETGVITPETLPVPKSNYGKSKLEAEALLKPLVDVNFSVTVIRPPMVYGNGCKGNFQSVVSLVKKSPFFPKCHNSRSMIYIDNLCEFICTIVGDVGHRIYFPQNKEHMDTSDLAQWIAECMGKKLMMSILMGFAIKLLIPFFSAARKGFGSLQYQGTEVFDFRYCVCGNEESVKLSVRGL